jgi:drug/metabolite transporter (DMT)-like permease
MPVPVLKPTALVPASGPLAAVVWMTVSMALLAGLAIFARGAMYAGVHPVQVVFLRNSFAALMLLPLLYWRGPSLLHSAQISLYGVRVLVSFLSMTAWFYAMSLITLGEVTAISYLAPVFGTLGAIFLLGEKVRLRRWTAILVGLAGALIILRPGMSPMGLGQMCAVFTAMSMGLGAIMLKQLTAVDDPDKIVTLTHLLLTPLSLVPALFVWSWPSLEAWLLVLGMGLTAMLGHMTLVRGYAAADASLAMTLEFSRLPFTVGIAFLAFGETIDAWTWVGAAVIFASAVYITRREARLAAERRGAVGSKGGTS